MRLGVATLALAMVAVVAGCGTMRPLQRAAEGSAPRRPGMVRLQLSPRSTLALRARSGPLGARNVDLLADVQYAF